MMLNEDSQEGQSECAHLLYKDSSCVGSYIGNYRQLKRKYLRMSMYASANSCVDNLNTEGCRDPASWLTQIADKRREPEMPAETDKKQQERLRKWRREIGADTLLSLQMEEMRTCQCERLAAETIADKHARLQQISELQHKPKGYQLRVSLRHQIAADSTCQCERLAAETTPERGARFYSK